jgi:hypothetical protein
MLSIHTSCSGLPSGFLARQPRAGMTTASVFVGAAREPPVFRRACRYTLTFILRGGSIGPAKV